VAERDGDKRNERDRGGKKKEVKIDTEDFWVSEKKR